MKALSELAKHLRDAVECVETSVAAVLPTDSMTISQALDQLRTMTENSVKVGLAVWDHRTPIVDHPEWSVTIFPTPDLCLTETGRTLAQAVAKLTAARSDVPPQTVPDVEAVVAEATAIDPEKF